MTAPRDRRGGNAAAWVDEFLAALASQGGIAGAHPLDLAEKVAAARVVDVLVERDVVAEADLAVIREVRRRRRDDPGRPA